VSQYCDLFAVLVVDRSIIHGHLLTFIEHFDRDYRAQSINRGHSEAH